MTWDAKSAKILKENGLNLKHQRTTETNGEKWLTKTERYKDPLHIILEEDKMYNVQINVSLRKLFVVRF